MISVVIPIHNEERSLLPLYDRLSKRTGAAAFEATTPVLGE